MNKSSHKSSHKFRPAFTQAQLERMRELTLISDHIEDVQIRKIVAPLLAKISIGVTSPAYSISPESAKKSEDRDLAYRYENDLMSPEEVAEYESKILGV